MSIIIFIIILAILVFVHELGHFLVAKKSGIRVDEFGIGFPPRIFERKWGDTLYTLNAVPFGGFVKIFGEDPHSEEILGENKKESFQYKTRWIQASVLVAGVTFNIIFAWILISIGFMIGLPTPADLAEKQYLKDVSLTVIEVVNASPAEKSGFIAGDIIKSISNGSTEIQTDKLTAVSFTEMVSSKDTQFVDVTVLRGKEEIKIKAIPETSQSGKKMIGVALDSIGILKLPFLKAFIEGTKTSFELTKATTVGLLSFFWDAVRLRSDFSQVSGPVGIARVVGEANTLGFVYLLSLTALISINLAIINLLPFPALDGGRLLFVFIEAVIRRPLPAKFVGYANTVGFAFLIMLMIAVTGHDIAKLF
jgi:regulator of sigma E protease